MISDAARQLYQGSIVIDMHNDMPTRVLDEGFDPDIAHQTGATGAGHTDLPRLITSGLTATFLVAWVDASFTSQTPDGSFDRAMAGLAVVRDFAGRHPERALFATTAADIGVAKATGRVAVFAAVEGGHAIESSLAKLDALYAAGARYLTLTWNNGNAWAGSSNGVDGTRTGGLTPFGRDVIRRMNERRMLVDVSHVSPATLDDVLDASAAPVIASHSNARALNDHPRNLTDDQLRAIAAAGGVVNVNFYPKFLDAGYPAPVPASRVIDHIAHIAAVAGIAHVGLGSDFDGISAVPAGLDDVQAMPRIAGDMLDRGFAAAEVAQVLGGNMLRVLEQVLSSP
jgi:membrane dipeptidase